MKQALKPLGSTIKMLITSSMRKNRGLEPISPLFDPPLILNDNLRFNANDYELFLVPKHPQMIVTDPKYLKFNQMSIVMEFHFLKKKFLDSQCKEIWNQSKAMRFKFEHLGKILDVGPGLSQQHTMGLSTPEEGKDKKEIYQIKYNQKDHQVQFWHKEISSQKSSELFKASISEPDFEIIQTIIKESLFDLSGLRLLFDIRCLQELQKITKTSRKKQKQFQQAEEYYNKSD